MSDGSQQQRDQASEDQADGEGALQTRPVGKPARQWPQDERDGDVERRQQPDAGQVDAEIRGVQREGETNDPEAQAGEESFRD
jgi:hypothetical protein